MKNPPFTDCWPDEYYDQCTTICTNKQSQCINVQITHNEKLSAIRIRGAWDHRIGNGFLKPLQYIGDYREFHPSLLHFAFLHLYFEKTEAGPVDERSGSCGRAKRVLWTSIASAVLFVPDDFPLVAVAADLARDRFPVRACLSPSPF